MKPLISNPADAVRGAARPPGDKSISHRALMVGAVAVGETVIEGLLDAEDVRATAAALGALGVAIGRGPAAGEWRVAGRGVGGLVEPENVLDLGNSGTGARLLLGLLASHPFKSIITGDASLRERPMARVIEPLERMGASAQARAGGRLPIALTGALDPTPISWRLDVPSAQVKSAILLAGLNTGGITTVFEPRPSRDHSEIMLRHFGAEITSEPREGGGVEIALAGQPEIEARHVAVPGDPSAAAFPAVAALLAPDSEIRLDGVGVNPLRMGLYRTLEAMGAEISYAERAAAGGEPVADISVRSGTLEGVTVPAERAPTMIDEYPILAVAAAAARGKTVFEGVGELRVKESDRLAAVAEGLARCGVEVEAAEDSLVIHGRGGPPPGPEAGVVIETRRDHRIAMAFLVMGLTARAPVAIDDGSMIETSFPDFAGFMNRLGADIGRAKGDR